MAPSAATTSTLMAEQTVNPRKSSKQQPDATDAVLDAPQDEADNFFWTYTEEPHRSRRQAIIKAHPEVNTSRDE